MHKGISSVNKYFLAREEECVIHHLKMSVMTISACDLKYRSKEFSDMGSGPVRKETSGSEVIKC